MRVLTNLTAMTTKFDGEYNGGKSMTIPGQAISPQELLRRYATGQPLGLKSVDPIYDDEDAGYEVPEFYKMDKIDRLHYLQENTQEVIEARERLQQFIRENEQRKQKRAQKAEQEADSEPREQAKRSEAGEQANESADSKK